MEISSTTPSVQTSITSLSQPVNNDRDTKAAPEQKPSTVVNISEEAKKLNEAKETNLVAAPNNAPENKAPQSKEASESPGIEFVSGESKKGSVSTYA